MKMLTIIVVHERLSGKIPRWQDPAEFEKYLRMFEEPLQKSAIMAESLPRSNPATKDHDHYSIFPGHIDTIMKNLVAALVKKKDESTYAQGINRIQIWLQYRLRPEQIKEITAGGLAAVEPGMPFLIDIQNDPIIGLEKTIKLIDQQIARPPPKKKQGCPKHDI
jgi:L-ascorbate metabolism protein UlaG (beta-lactamase superfamily)